MSALKSNLYSIAKAPALQNLYLGIFCEDPDTPNVCKRLHQLSPYLMQWDEHCYLLDMKKVESFWLYQAKKTGKDPITLWEELLPNTTAVIADHPWQCLILLMQLSKKPVCGIVHFQSPIGEKIFSSLSWDDFSAPLTKLSEHWQQTKILRKFQAANFRTEIKQWRQALTRLGINGPSMLKNASPDAFMRRFGKYLGLVWQWSFKAQEDKSSVRLLFQEDPLGGRLHNFPWHNWQNPDKPTVFRHLDTPLKTWDELREFLREDFDKLCQNEELWQPRRERVLRFKWVITFYSLKTLEVDVRLRHPHKLIAEAGVHKVALFQTELAYESCKKATFTAEEEEDAPEGFSIISWRLSIEETLTLSSNLSAFLEAKGLTEDPAERLAELENQLPRPLSRYEIKRSFVPELGFSEARSAYKLKPADQQWYLGAKMRPLFCFAKKKRLHPPKQNLFFLERVYIKTYPKIELRDYYIFKNMKELLWVYRDQDDQWFLHGIYA